MSDIAVIILAAGEGSRMKSNRAKVLHEIAGVPMVRYVVDTALTVAEEVVVVIGYQAEAVRNALASYKTLRFAVQEEQLGTGHAVRCAIPQIPVQTKDVVVLCGDTPLIRAETVRGLMNEHRSRGSFLSLITTTLQNPLGYGRIVLEQEGRPIRIVEEADATEAEKCIRLVNTGAYCMNLRFLNKALGCLQKNNAQAEFYLTDVVEQAFREGRPALLFEVDDPVQVMGVNTPEELAQATRIVLAAKGRSA